MPPRPLLAASAGALAAGALVGGALIFAVEEFGWDVRFNGLVLMYLLVGLASGGAALAVRREGRRTMIVAGGAGGGLFMMGLVAAALLSAYAADPHLEFVAETRVLLFAMPSLGAFVGTVAGAALAFGKKPQGTPIAG